MKFTVHRIIVHKKEKETKKKKKKQTRKMQLGRSIGMAGLRLRLHGATGIYCYERKQINKEPFNSIRQKIQKKLNLLNK